MCIQTHPRRSKASRPSTPSKPSKPSKHIKTSHQQTNTNTKPTKPIETIQNKKSKHKSVSFNDVVMVRPFHQHQPTNKTIKSVGFHEVVMVRPVLHLQEYTDHEKSQYWYVLADKKRFKAELLSTLRSIRHGSFDGCSRGLEKLLDGGRTRERRRVSIREVLEEQDNQRAAQMQASKASIMVYDSNKFRKTYKPYSRAARHVAHAVGKIDEMAVDGGAAASACQQQQTKGTRKCKTKSSSKSMTAPVQTTG